MNLSDLIRKGYFPKELPPSFNTEKYADSVISVLSAWDIVFENNTKITSSTFVLPRLTDESNNHFKGRKKNHSETFIARYNSSRGCVFSISKGKLSRRFLQIPNPKHFALLSRKIADNWDKFEDIYKLSDYSQSYPIIETSPQKRTVSTYSKNVSSFRNQLLKTSIDKLIEIKVDISKFYPTIYTHSITWAFLDKEKAKFYFKQKNRLDELIDSGDADAFLYKVADNIDESIRSCQERQSIGIPIGPDTSHIIAEAVACRIDYILKNKYSALDIKACRYYDDYYIYASSKDEADKVLKGLQLILSDFQLEMNEGKVKIREFPFAIEDEFTTTLHQFDFKKTNIENSIKHYFSIVWAFVEKNPKKADWILKYSLRTFEFVTNQIPKKNWKTFEDLLIKSALIEPSILDIVTRILLTYSSYLDAESKNKLSNLVNSIIKSHCLVNHNFEVAWALWMAKSFDIDIEEEAANCIIKTKDSISNLILLDLSNNTSLIKGNPSFSILEADFKDDILFSEYWILAYESIKKGWLTPSEPNLLENNEYFKLLKDNDVEFYDSSKQLTPYKEIGETKDKTDKTEPESNKETKTTEQPIQSSDNVEDIPIIDFYYF